MNVVPWLALAAGAVLVAVGARSLAAGRAERRYGRLVSVDAGAGVTLRSDRYRLVGRPDALRRRRDGAVVPVELKRGRAPARGAYPSHVAQVGAYCLLVEEAAGRSPPFGVVRYRDREVVVPWNAAARKAILELRRRATGPYDGRADPSPAKCGGCVWSPTCDASAAR